MSYETDDKMVSHPDHYQSGKYEVIDIIDEFTKGLEGTEAVCTANAIKYILRWKKKNGIQDVKKAIWYLQHLVDKDEEKNSKPSAVVIHKLAGGNYGIENVTDDQEEHAKFDEWLIGKREEEAKNKEEFDDWLQMVTDDPEPQVEPSMDKEESDLSVEIHTNAAGVTVPDSEPWVPVGTGRIHRKRRKDCSNCRYSVEGDESGLNYGPCCGDKTFHTPHGCDLWERRPRTNEQSSET